MKKNTEIEVDDALIGKYLSGEAAPEEAIILDHWIALSEENRRRFHEARQLWDHTGSGVLYDSPLAEKEWERMEAAFETPKKVFRFWKIAAVILVIIAGAALGYLLQGRSAKQEFVRLMEPKETTETDTLPDHSVATVIRGARLDISKEFGKGIRKLRLRRGEGYFVIGESAGDPFIIQAGEVKITVLGTSFEVNNDSATVTLAVTGGKVKMETTDQAVEVTGGSTATYFRRTGELRLYRDSLDKHAGSYATGSLKFDNMSLAEVRKILEKTYSIRIHWQDSSLENLRINTRFDRRPLEYVLKVIGLSLNIQYRTEGRDVYFWDKNIP